MRLVVFGERDAFLMRFLVFVGAGCREREVGIEQIVQGVKIDRGFNHCDLVASEPPR